MEVPRLHQSLATILVTKSPLHAWHRAFHPEPEEYDEARLRGSIAHSVLLGGAQVEVIDAKDWRTNAAKEAREAARAEGKLPILKEKFEMVAKLIEATLEGLKRNRIELSGKSELELQWETPGGVKCEGRLDHLNLGKNSAKILDLKFCDSADKKTCINKFISYGYDIQWAAYTQAVEVLNPSLAGRVEMEYIFCEVDPPFAMRVMPLAGSMKTSGQWRWGMACDIWKECLERYGVEKPWPSFRDDWEPAECPPWAMSAQVNAEIGAEISSREGAFA